MAAIDTTGAIKAVTKLLISRLTTLTGVSVGAFRTEKAAGEAGPRLNLFLYEVDQPGDLRGIILEPDQPTPLWLSLKYLLTAFDAGKESDSFNAHGLLGQGMAALQSLNYLDYSSAIDPDLKPLDALPERLKISFDPATPELLSKVMQGSDEKFRLSVAFHVRPVLILPHMPPKTAQLVGIDYTAGGAVIGRQGIQTAVTASLGPRPQGFGVVLKKDQTESLLPHDVFQPEDVLELHGDDLNLGGLEVVLGGVTLAIISQRSNTLRVKVVGPTSGAALLDALRDGSTVSAGHHPLVVRQRLATGRYRSAPPLAARLLPVVLTATAPAAYPGNLRVTGYLLGTATDDVEIALWRDGTTFKVFATPATAPAPGPGQPQPQDTLTVALAEAPALPGPYLVIVNVNGQPARRSPAVVIV